MKKKKPLVIFGTGQIAELAHFYFSTDSTYEVVAFTVDREFCATEEFCDRPLVAFQEIDCFYPASKNELFIALSYSKLNTIRKEKFLTAKKIGYRLASYLSSNATFLSKISVGENCFILEDNTVQPFVEIGSNVTLWSGNHIGHHSTIGDHTFIASQAVISGGVQIGEQCFIGVNATIRDHIRIGNRCVIGAGALIMRDADDDGVYIPVSTEKSGITNRHLSRI